MRQGLYAETALSWAATSTPEFPTWEYSDSVSRRLSVVHPALAGRGRVDERCSSTQKRFASSPDPGQASALDAAFLLRRETFARPALFLFQLKLLPQSFGVQPIPRTNCVLLRAIEHGRRGYTNGDPIQHQNLELEVFEGKALTEAR